MQRLGALRPEVPLHVVITQVGLGVALLGVDEVGELVGISDEEHGRVVAHEVPVALIGVELECEPAHITLGIGRPALAGDGRETQEAFGLLADFGKERGLGVLGDVVGDREGAVRAAALGVDDALGDAFAVEVLHLLEELGVLHEQRALGACGQRLLTPERCALSSGHVWAFGFVFVRHASLRDEGSPWHPMGHHAVCFLESF